MTRFDYVKRSNGTVLVTDVPGYESCLFNRTMGDVSRLASYLGASPYIGSWTVSDFEKLCLRLWNAFGMTDEQVAIAIGQIEDELKEPVQIDEIQARAIDLIARESLAEHAAEIDNPYACKSDSGRRWVEVDPVDVEDIVNSVLGNGGER